MSDLKNGIDIEKEKLETESYILTCRIEGKKESNLEVDSLFFTTNVKDENGKKLSMKLGTGMGSKRL